MNRPRKTENILEVIAAKGVSMGTEQVDDIPLLFAQMERMNLSELIDKHFPAHGNWMGLSRGQVVTTWLSYILSCGDHCLSHVEEWADNLSHVLKSLVGEEVHRLDFSDDRLADILGALSDDAAWRDFEEEFGQHQIRVYDLTSNRIRLDTTTSSGYWEVTPDGLFQFGHGKDHRPDLPQVKAMLSTLDPLGLPLASDVVPGNRADDPLYIPVIERVSKILNRKGLLYIGDCKMASLKTRAFIQRGGNYYLCPLSETIVSEEKLEEYLEPVWAKKRSLSTVSRTDADGKEKAIAEGFELKESVSANLDGKEIKWKERRLLVRSFQFAEAGAKTLKARVKKAKESIEALNGRGRGKKKFDDIESLRAAAIDIAKKCRVENILEVTCEETVRERPVRQYGGKPARTEADREFNICVSTNEAALEKALRRFGWRVYGTNHPKGGLSLEQAVLAYREQYIIERGFGRLKGKPLAIRPMYLELDEHATGLLRLLTIGLRILILIEFAARQKLAEEGSKLDRVYPGNPKRATARPTTELLLRAFNRIDLVVFKGNGQTCCFLPPLSNAQQRILGLLGFSTEIYTRLAGEFYDTS